jgi:DNA uptake protein ComE-like DNA-binding protein
MKKRIVKLMLLAIFVGSSGTWLPALEDAPKLKQAAPEAPQDAKAKATLDPKKKAALAKKMQAKAKLNAEVRAKAVDINHASKEELMRVPGVTGDYAAAIIAKRPYKTKADLVTKHAIPMGVYQHLSKLVAAK